MANTLIKSKRSKLMRAMNGQGQAPIQQPPQFLLPENYGFNDLAGYEEQRRNALGKSYQDQIDQLQLGIQGQYDNALKSYQDTSASRRASLSKSLADTAQKNFSLQNPKILEDLNSRGLLNSESALVNAQAQALKELEIGNQNQLNQFDTSTRGFEDALSNQRLSDLNQLKSAGVSGNLQGQQDALDSALDLRRGQLESSLQNANAAREEQMARDLAKQAQRGQITNSLIGLGGQLGGSILTAKLMGGGGSGLGMLGLGGGGAAGVGGSGVGYASGGLAGSSGFPVANGLASGGAGGAGGIGLGGGALIAGAGLGAMGLDKWMNNRIDYNKRLGATGGSAARFLMNPIGYQLNKAKELIKDPGATAKKALGKAPAQISNVASSVGKSISNVFCFEAGTPITMWDGSERPINNLYVGASTKGGEVVSIRISKTGEGTRYLYKGIQVTGSHAVKENGKWIRVKDSDHAAPVSGEGIVWSLVTTDHRIWIRGIEMADEHETDMYETLTIDQSLEHLNNQEKNILVEA